MKGFLVSSALRVWTVDFQPIPDDPNRWLVGKRKVSKADVYAKASEAITAAETQLALIRANLEKRLADLECRAGILKRARMRLYQGE